MDSAVIFDVDGVLLEMTRAEEDLFFVPFRERYGLTGLSRDWDSYRTRNDEDIMGEILEAHGHPLSERPAVVAHYEAVTRERLEKGEVTPVEIPGARALLGELPASTGLGIATANLTSIARLRLEARGLWNFVSRFPFGAEGGGHKRETVAKAIAATGLPKDRIVYIGDNLNDVDAGLANGVNFIGFAVEHHRRERLKRGGATHTAGDHRTTRALIDGFLGR